MYREVLKQNLDLKVDAVRAKKSKYLPTVLTKDEIFTIIKNMSGVHQLLIKLLYGTGLRLSEGLNLRVKDVDLAQQIIVRDPKGNESRVTMLPESIALRIKNLFTKCKDSTSTRFTKRLWFGLFTFRVRKKISQSKARLDLAVCFSFK